MTSLCTHPPEQVGIAFDFEGSVLERCTCGATKSPGRPWAEDVSSLSYRRIPNQSERDTFNLTFGNEDLVFTMSSAQVQKAMDAQPETSYEQVLRLIDTWDGELAPLLSPPQRRDLAQYITDNPERDDDEAPPQ